MKDPHGILDVKREQAMGQFGRITSLKSLPSEKILIACIKEAVKLNDKVMVKVLEVDIPRSRIALSIKQTQEAPVKPQRAQQHNNPQHNRRNDDLSALNVNDALAALKKKFGK